MRIAFFWIAGLLLAIPSLRAEEAAPAKPLVMVVMDPLAKPLSCPCVAGYAQRDYEKLGEAMSKSLGREIKVVFNESLAGAKKKAKLESVDLVIGKQSVILHDAAGAGFNLSKVAMLTGKDGLTTQRGLIVVAAADPAKEVADLKDYRIYFGPQECDEKHSAAMRVLAEHGVKTPVMIETAVACDEGAVKILKLAEAGTRGCAVISSYAKPLLEGCGQVPKGSLRVVGETEDIPFIAVYINADADSADQTKLTEALMKSTNDIALRLALETKRGFVAATDAAKKKDTLSGSSENPDWTGWRGSNRDAVVPWLPEKLPSREAIVWSKRMSSPALAGVAATRDFVIVADRDPADRVDIFRCFHSDGSDAWTLRYSAPGTLDYGNSARATPLIHGSIVFLSGAQGHFHAVDLETGKVLWKKHFQKDFDGPAKLSWGFCGSPIVVDDRLILQPGGPKSSLVALNPATGDVLWTSPGRPPGHSSFVSAQIAGKTQLIGYDDATLGGWDSATGERLWTVKPESSGDFNVPTPILWRSKVVVATENNGTRIYAFDAEGRIIPEPVAANDELLPDCQSPVLVKDLLFGVSHQLFCLRPAAGLERLWRSDDPEFREYASLIAGPDRILATTLHGRLMLLDAVPSEFRKSSELKLFDDEAGLYSHPAIVGHRLYVRGSSSLVCLDLSDQPQ